MIQNSNQNENSSSTLSDEEVTRRSEQLLLLMGRLTVLRTATQTLPLAHLTALCDALVEGNAVEAVYEYHAMTAALLEAGSRRVTGNIWKDFLFAQLLEVPNRFAQLAAAGSPDPPVASSMGHDLKLLQELFDLDSAALIECIESLSQRRNEPSQRERSQAERLRSNEKWMQREERISRMASSAWGLGRLEGNIPPAEPKAPAPAPAPIHRPVAAELPPELDVTEWIHWQYDEPAGPIDYVADEALALLYRQFLASEDWSELTDTLQEFHAHYGCGEFLRYRLFAAFTGRMYGMEDEQSPAWDAVLSVGQQKELLYANILRFLHTGKGQNTLLYGADGMGKTSLLLALMDELPELRLVMLPPSMENIHDIMLSLSKQPFRFLALVDDTTMDAESYRRLKAASTLNRSFTNILLCATSMDQAPDSSVFSLQIAFPMPSFEEFCRVVYGLVSNRISDVSRQRVQDACEAHRQRSGDFSIRAAIAAADQFVRWHQH